MIKLIAISLLATIIFGLIDGLFFLIAEETLQSKLQKIKFFDADTAELLTGGLSASVSIFISTYINTFISKRYEVLENPFIDSLGIIIGTFIVILFFKIYLKLRKDKKRKVKNIFYARE